MTGMRFSVYVTLPKPGKSWGTWMNRAQPSIAHATIEHADIVAGLLCDLLTELANGDGPTFSDLQKTTEQLLGEGLVFGLIAMNEDDPVGLLMLNECAAIYAGGRFGEITELYVTPEQRSCGVASALLTEAKEFARERGWVRLEVGAPDQPAWSRTLSFYLREGFEEVGPRLRIKL